MKIELLSPHEIPRLIEIEQQANPYPWQQSAFDSSFADSYFSYKLLDDSGEIRGFYFAQLILEQLELFSICVATNMQGRGYGKALLQHFLHEGQSRGATEAFLEVRSTNHAAIALYEKYGFSTTGVRKNYYVCGDSKAGAVLMALVL
ncbi:ribosomal protein S18-alanine N-acetyltransferase [Rheinheimera maricola]|uniref:[Ribosomal protein bS18]-alanine N-acetyltransferase n=1 Tax=Rheinheimera maricola TaxID=2793282 RepID=A0ABS7X9A6_9GAMM|nr:ribosomal protein S18-alanine N-acetyltransferase [Rheinheimera maricola]MBZ9612130.1 ribosomal protein S18-alanine N-acetyltransferase [Rheinheimera maricola]